MFKIVADQAKNVKKAFAKQNECVDVIEVTQKLLNRQRKVDLIAKRREEKKNRDAENSRGL